MKYKSLASDIKIHQSIATERVYTPVKRGQELTIHVLILYRAY